MAEIYNLLVDPVDKKPLLWLKEGELLFNPREKKAYPVKDGIPELVPSKAVKVEYQTPGE
jgi:uncharacterized protein YbaR (Trm112 family)